jgi:hypothetical protein
MTLLDSTTLTSELVDAVRSKLQNALAPLKLAEILKGLPKPRSMKAAEFQNDVRSILDEQVRIGAIFRSPSGKNGETRFWSRDEKHLLREKALEVAAAPQTLSALKKALAKEVKGTDAAFVEMVIREMIEESKLFERPAKTARSGPLFGATPLPPPPPSLERPKHAKALNKLVKECQKLLGAANASVEELMHVLQTHLRSATIAEPSTPSTASVEPIQPMQSPTAEATPTIAEPPPPPRAELDEVILKALEHAPVLSLAELRASMPAEYRGSVFDETVLRLADEQQVILSQDAVSAHFSDAEKAELVRDGEALFTTIAKWS